MAIVAEADFIDYVGSEVYANQPWLAASLNAAEYAIKHGCHRNFDVAGTPRTVTDGVTVITDATVTSATAAFNTTDIGMTIAGVGIPTGTTIASINSTTSVELSAAATANGTALTFTITSTARLFKPPTYSDVLYVDDFSTITGLTITDNAVAVAAADFQLEPLNGLDETGTAVPYTAIRRITGSWYWSGDKATVSVTARWGWVAVPADVVEAVVVLAKDLAALRDARFGVAGFGEFGVVRMRENPQVMSLLAPHVRHDRVGV